MKKLFHAAVWALPIAALLIVASCSDSDNENDESVIELTGGTTTQQTVYVDETQNAGSIAFKAPAPWTATVAEVQTKADVGRLDWLTLSAYEGKAGEVSLTMNLTVNTTGQDRKAEIRIVCGSTTLTITVEQKAMKENGELPDEAKPDEPENPDDPNIPDNPDPEQPDHQNLKNRIVKIESVEWNEKFPEQKGSDTSTTTFAYDDNGRLIEVKEVYKRSDSLSPDGPITSTTIHTTTITYGEGTVSYELTDYDDGVLDYKMTGSVVLDENSRAVLGQEISSDMEEGDNGKNDWKETYELSYDADGYLVRSVRTYTTDIGERTTYYRTTWTDGNPTQVDWEITGTPCVDKATYGTVPNTANLDLNWLLCVFETEGWECSVGDSSRVFASLGYTGNRSKHLAESVTSSLYNGKDYDTKCIYELDSEGRVSKITKTDGDDSNKYFIEGTITYAE